MGVMYAIMSLKFAFIDEGLETPKSELTFGSQIENGGCGVRMCICNSRICIFHK